jgi:membrane protease YdiL (CAAX protease family)
MTEKGIKNKPFALKVIIHCIMFLALMYFAQYVAATALTVLRGFTAIGDTAFIMLFSVISVALSYGLALVYLKVIFRFSPADFRIKKPSSALPWLFIALLTPALVWAFFLIFIPGEIIIQKMPAAEIMLVIMNSLVVASARAAFAEELWFRGGVLRFLEMRFGRIAAVIVSSVAFGCIHIYNYFQDGTFNFRTHMPVILLLSFLGGYFALLAIASDSLLIPIFAHTLWNFFLGDGVFGINYDQGAIITYLISEERMVGDENAIFFVIPMIGILCLMMLLTIIVMKKKGINLR